MFGYVGDLRSATQGRASYSMQFAHYEEVPNSIAEEIIAQQDRRAGREPEHERDQGADLPQPAAVGWSGSHGPAESCGILQGLPGPPGLSGTPSF